jgi:hypothetical protein
MPAAAGDTGIAGEGGYFPDGEIEAVYWMVVPKKIPLYLPFSKGMVEERILEYALIEIPSASILNKNLTL